MNSTTREKLLAAAEECEMIASMAADRKRRDGFRRLAANLRAKVADLAAEMSRAKGSVRDRKVSDGEAA